MLRAFDFFSLRACGQVDGGAVTLDSVVEAVESGTASPAEVGEVVDAAPVVFGGARTEDDGAAPFKGVAEDGAPLAG